MNNLEESRRRIQRKIASATSSLMSNTKWRKLFRVIRDLEKPMLGIQWKFINDSRIFTHQIPAESDLEKECFGDVLPYPYGSYNEIEWLLIPYASPNIHSDPKRPLPLVENDLPFALAVLEHAGKFPIEHTSQGIKIFGYKWNQKIQQTPA